MSLTIKEGGNEQCKWVMDDKKRSTGQSSRKISTGKEVKGRYQEGNCEPGMALGSRPIDTYQETQVFSGTNK